METFNFRMLMGVLAGVFLVLFVKGLNMTDAGVTMIVTFDLVKVFTILFLVGSGLTAGLMLFGPSIFRPHLKDDGR